MLFIAITFFCITLLCKTKNFYWFEKAASRHWKIYIMKKLSGHTHTYRVASRIYRITSSSSSRFAWYELLMNQEGRKMSLTDGMETRLSSGEYSLTCFPIYSLQAALPWMFTHRNVNNLVFASQVIISSKLQTYLDHLRWGTVGKCTIEDCDWCLILFIAIGARFGVYAPKCKQFISHRTCLQKKLKIHVSSIQFSLPFSSNLVNIDRWFDK